MDAKFIALLRDRFDCIPQEEIDQAVLIAEKVVADKWPDFSQDERGRMTYSFVYRACQKRIRGDERRNARFQSYQTDDFPEELLACAGPGVTAEMEEREEWEAFVGRLPWLSRFLIETVNAELDLHPPEDWSRSSVTELRRRIRKRFMTGSRYGIFTERQYKEAQMKLRAALHGRNESRKHEADE